MPDNIYLSLFPQRLWYKSGLSDQIVRLYQNYIITSNLLYLKQVKYVKLYRKLLLFIKFFFKFQKCDKMSVSKFLEAHLASLAIGPPIFFLFIIWTILFLNLPTFESWLWFLGKEESVFH